MTIRDLTATDNFFLLAGPCVIENEDMAMRIAERIVAMTSDRNIPYVFKALILDDVEKIGELIVCQDGEN